MPQNAAKEQTRTIHIPQNFEYPLFHLHFRMIKITGNFLSNVWNHTRVCLQIIV